MNWLAIPLRWLLAAPARWMGSVRGVFGWSLPTRVAVILAIFLVLCVLGYFVASSYAPNAVFDPKRDWRFIVSLLVLVIAIPISAYYAVRSWLESEPSQYPDLDEAWSLGAAAIARAGVNVDQCPLFLATGIASPRDADHLMQAIDWKLLVDGKPEGKSPLRWYASQDAIIVFLLDASAASMLQRQVQETVPPTAPSLGGGGVRGTLVGSGFGEDQARMAADGQMPNIGIRGTIISDAAAPVAPPAVPASVGLRGTMLTGQSAVVGGPQPNAAAFVNLDRKEIAEQADRLARVCRLAAESRQPLCPINGSIALVDWQTLVGSPSGQLSTVLREDAVRMIEATQLHAPMAVLITGLDDEMGFIELTRRVGENRARENRFGHGFNHQAPLEAGQLAALGKQACGAFEDWIYELFRHPDALGRTNNDKLYALLCKMRSEVQPKVVELLSGLSGARVPVGGRGPLLCGCYFGAAGGARMRQAFVRSVFGKLLELEEDLEWSEDAWRKDSAFQRIVSSMLVVNALLVFSIIGLLVFYIYNRL